MSQSKYDEKAEKSVLSLQPDFEQRARQWLAECRSQGLNPLIHFGARDIQDDDATYAKGTRIAEAFQVVGIGSGDNDHLQDARFPSFADLSPGEFGRFPSTALV